MKEAKFRQFIAQFQSLSASQRQRLWHLVEQNDQTQDILDASFRHCPHCQSKELKPWGSSHGLPRYRCAQCRRTSNPLTKTPLSKLHHKDCWLKYAQALIDGLSVRKAAERCNIHKDTAFRWRHRFLTLIEKHQANHEEGIVEADETFFLESFKGQRKLSRPARKRGGVGSTRGYSPEHIAVLIVRDRHRATADFILPNINKTTISEALGKLIDKDAVLCTDGAAVYASFARDSGIQHEVVKAQKQRVRGAFHIQNINAYDSRLKGWMKRFNGVATKYLKNYLGWRRLLERYQRDITPELCLTEAISLHSQQVMQT